MRSARNVQAAASTRNLFIVRCEQSVVFHVNVRIETTPTEFNVTPKLIHTMFGFSSSLFIAQT